MAGGVTVKDVNAHEFVKAYAAYLKTQGKLPIPSWTDLVKTATFKELGPLSEDWFYVRAAAIARHIYLRKSVGIGALQKVHGGRKRRGVRPNKHADASGSVIRKAVQSLEKIQILEKDSKGGRRITKAGQRDLDLIASQIASKA